MGHCSIIFWYWRKVLVTEEALRENDNILPPQWTCTNQTALVQKCCMTTFRSASSDQFGVRFHACLQPRKPNYVQALNCMLHHRSGGRMFGDALTRIGQAPFRRSGS